MYLCHYTCACSINLIDICTLKRQCVGVVYQSKAIKVHYIINTNHKVSDDICADRSEIAFSHANLSYMLATEHL